MIMGSNLKQPCWNCKKYLKGCSWSRDFKPIENWTAIATNIKGNKKPSYNIIYCPEFEGEDPKPLVKEMAMYLGVNVRTYYRMREHGKLPKDIYKKTILYLKEQKSEKFNNKTT